MVGGNVDSAQLGSLGDRIGKENPGLNAIVSWKLQRSSEPQHVNVVYDVRKARNTLGVSLAGGAYHSRQGFGSPLFKVDYTYAPAGTLRLLDDEFGGRTGRTLRRIPCGLQYRAISLFGFELNTPAFALNGNQHS